jgi:acetoin utilization deacetylase AcuC-like enzyme
MISLFYSDHHSIELPENHRFPMEKYLLLRQELQKLSWGQKNFEFFPTKPCDWEDVLLAHDELYVQKLNSDDMPKLEKKAIGFPLSDRLVTRSRSSVNGFLNACDSAFRTGFSANLSGGTHHAHRDRGEGFCVFNDFAIAALKLIKNKAAKKVLILDLDVHQGNGNSSILGSTPEVYTVSFHGKHNYPYRKVPSCLDIEFENGTGDSEYLESLERTLIFLEQQDFDILLYQAGVDALETDKLGKLSLTAQGLEQRDRMVLNWAKSLDLPVALGLGGGYSNPIHPTISAHLKTFETAVKIFQP